MPAIHYRPRYSVSDYEQWEGDWELWDGLPVSMSPSANYGHMKLSQALSYALAREIEEREKECGDCQVLYEIDWRVNEHTVLRPDILVICQRKPSADGWITDTPTLITEILSPTTAERDRNEKKAIYATEGVLHYVLVDPEQRTLEHFQLQGGQYAQTVGDPLVLKLHDTCEIEIPLSRIFR